MATIYNYANDTPVSGTSGNDEIQNGGFHTVYPYWHDGGSNVTIDAGAGDDTIYNSSTKKMTIAADTGDDVVNMARYSPNNSKKFLLEYASGDGSDTVYGFNSDDTLKISDDSHSTAKSGNDVFVTVGEGSLLLKNVYAITDSININGTKIKLEPVVKLSDGEKISVFRDSVSVIGSAGNDSIENYSNDITISVGDGNDYIFNYESSNVTLDGGKGNDSISVTGGNNVSINGGDGNDYIFNKKTGGGSGRKQSRRVMGYRERLCKFRYGGR